MGSGPCSRCGRPPPEGEESADPAVTPLGAVRRPWASIEGADVCPDCLTAVERREAGLRIVAAVEAEVDRRRREGVPPDDVEAALVDYAMGLRDELETPARDLGTASSGRLRLRVAMTAAFLTGHPLAVRIAGYSELQSALAAALRGPGWRIQGLHGEEGTFESGGGFVKALPLVIARRDGPQLLDELRYLLEDPGDDKRAVIARVAPGYDVEPAGLSVDVYDLGVAVLTAWFDVLAPSEAELPAVARTLKRLAWQRAGADGPSPIADALQRIARDTTEDYCTAVRTATPESIQSSWLAGRDVSATSVAAPDRGRLLWLHPVNLLERESPSKEAARQLAPAFHETINLTDAVFAPGVGWSAIITAPGSDSAAAPVELTQLHWAYYALYMEMDRGLLAILNHGRWNESTSLKGLEEDADNAFGDYLRVMEARARLDSALSARGGDELAIWQAIADVQRFDSIVEAVERKIETLERLTERRAEQAAASRSRRIGDILGSLTALTVLSVAVALVGYSVGNKRDDDGNLWLRIVVGAIAVAMVLLVLWFSFRERGRRRRT